MLLTVCFLTYPAPDLIILHLQMEFGFPAHVTTEGFPILEDECGAALAAVPDEDVVEDIGW